MKNKILLFVVLLTFVIIPNLVSQSQSELSEKIKDETNPVTKLELLEQFKEKYSNEENLKTILLQLSAVSFKAKKYAKTIEYAEKTLSDVPQLKDKEKIKIYLWLANAYYVTKSDSKKVIEYAEFCAELGKKLKGDKEKSKYTKKFIVPALRIQAKLYVSDPDPERVILSVPVILEAYKLDKSRSNEKLILDISKKLYNAKKYQEAVQCVEAIYNEEKPKRKYIDQLALCYNKLGDKAKAIEFYKKSYSMRSTAKTACKLGIMYKKNTEQAIEFFADAFVLSGMRKRSKYYKYLRQLVYNVKMKGKPEPKQNAYYEEVISAAKERTGK